MSFPSATPTERLNLLKDLEQRGGSVALKANPSAFSDYTDIIKGYPIVEERVAELVLETSKKQSINDQEKIDGLSVWAEQHELGEIRDMAETFRTVHTGLGLNNSAIKLQEISDRLKEDRERIFKDAVSALEIAEELGGSAAFAKYIESLDAAEPDVTEFVSLLSTVPATMAVRATPWNGLILVLARGIRGEGRPFNTRATALAVVGALTHDNNLPNRQTAAAISATSVRPGVYIVVANFSGQATAALRGPGTGFTITPRFGGQVRWRAT